LFRYLVFFSLFFLLFSPILSEFADARLPDDPCSFTKKHSYIKLSYNEQTRQHACEKVNYWVPERCGKIAELYKTDSACQPPKPISQPTPSEAKQTTPSCSSGYHLENNRCIKDRVVTPSCSSGYHLENNRCVADKTLQQPTYSKTNSSQNDIPWGFLVILGVIALGVLFAIIKVGRSPNGSLIDEHDDEHDDEYDDERY
jgi:hypothetical protein